MALPTRTMVEAAVTWADVSATPPKVPPASGTTGGGVTGWLGGKQVVTAALRGADSGVGVEACTGISTSADIIKDEATAKILAPSHAEPDRLRRCRPLVGTQECTFGISSTS